MQLILNNEFKEFLNIILNKAKSLGMRIFVVGGAVRDYYLNISSKDYDLILEGDAIEFSSLLPSEIQVKSVHKDFGTVKLIYKGLEYDLASTRTESYPYSGCLPVVDKIGVPVEIDYLRRDFSINAMYFEVLEDNEFKLVDLAKGLDDINSKILKVLHSKSYIDDPSRILRGLGFKYRFGFDFSELDKKLIENYLNNVDYSNMSKDRVLSVFKKTLEYPFGLVLFKEIIEKGYYKIVSPEIINIDLDLLKQIISDFKLGYKDFALLSEKIILNNIPDIALSDNVIDNFKALSKLDNVDLSYLYYFSKDSKILEYLKIKDIKVNLKGSDLLNLGYEQGKQIGEILDNLLEYKIKNPNITFNDEIAWVKSKYPTK